MSSSKYWRRQYFVTVRLHQAPRKLMLQLVAFQSERATAAQRTHRPCFVRLDLERCRQHCQDTND